jgi:hypothetical protein
VSAKPDVGHRATFLFLKKKLQNFTQENPTPNYNTNDEMK